MVFFLDLFFNLYIDNLFAKPVDPGVPPQYTLRQDRIAGTTSSWRAWAEAREVDEWIHSVAGVLDQGWNDQWELFRSYIPNFVFMDPLHLSPRVAMARPPRQYEFPTGYNSYFGPERFGVGEQFFHHSQQMLVRPNPKSSILSNESPSTKAANPSLPKTIPQLISEALRPCDPDLHQVLMGNVVLTGGGSLFAGFGDRLSNELSRKFTHVS
jgi:actin-like protein 6B